MTTPALPCVPCPAPTTAAVVLCDTAAGGAVTQFIRHITYDGAGQPESSYDTELDGTTEYTPAGDVEACA